MHLPLQFLSNIMYTCLEKGEELKGNYEGDEHTQRLNLIEFGHVQVLLKPKKSLSSWGHVIRYKLTPLHSSLTQQKIKFTKPREAEVVTKGNAEPRTRNLNRIEFFGSCVFSSDKKPTNHSLHNQDTCRKYYKNTRKSAMS